MPQKIWAGKYKLTIPVSNYNWQIFISNSNLLAYRNLWRQIDTATLLTAFLPHQKNRETCRNFFDRYILVCRHSIHLVEPFFFVLGGFKYPLTYTKMKTNVQDTMLKWRNWNINYLWMPSRITRSYNKRMCFGDPCRQSLNKTVTAFDASLPIHPQACLAYAACKTSI